MYIYAYTYIRMCIHIYQLLKYLAYKDANQVDRIMQKEAATKDKRIVRLRKLGDYMRFDSAWSRPGLTSEQVNRPNQMKCSNERFFQGLSTRVDTSKSLYARRQRERCADLFAPSTELFIFFRAAWNVSICHDMLCHVACSAHASWGVHGGSRMVWDCCDSQDVRLQVRLLWHSKMPLSPATLTCHSHLPVWRDTWHLKTPSHMNLVWHHLKTLSQHSQLLQYLFERQWKPITIHFAKTDDNSRCIKETAAHFMHFLVRVCEQDWYLVWIQRVCEEDYLVSITRGPTYRWWRDPERLARRVK